MRIKIGNFCIALGILLIAGAMLLFLGNVQEDAQAGASAANVVLKLEEKVEAQRATESPLETTLPDPYDPHMREVEIDGNAYIGYLLLPNQADKLPIMSDWDYDKLQIAPCRYAGSTKTNDLVLMAHNFDKHFGPLKDLKAGDVVVFTDMDEVSTFYEVVATEILDPTAVEDMRSGDFALTLFTCTYGGQYRVTVRCDRIYKD